MAPPPEFAEVEPDLRAQETESLVMELSGTLREGATIESPTAPPEQLSGGGLFGRTGRHGLVQYVQKRSVVCRNRVLRGTAHVFFERIPVNAG